MKSFKEWQIPSKGPRRTFLADMIRSEENLRMLENLSIKDRMSSADNVARISDNEPCRPSFGKCFHQSFDSWPKIYSDMSIVTLYAECSEGEWTSQSESPIPSISTESSITESEYSTDSNSFRSSLYCDEVLCSSDEELESYAQSYSDRGSCDTSEISSTDENISESE